MLEPSAGIGHFLGAMPAALAAQCTVTAIEIDRLSGRMLRSLYGASSVDVCSGAFEKTPLADAWYDLAIGNVPFGAYKVADSSNRPYGRFSIHNYLFDRALDLLRPGGLACFITSRLARAVWRRLLPSVHVACRWTHVSRPDPPLDWEPVAMVIKLVLEGACRHHPPRGSSAAPAPAPQDRCSFLDGQSTRGRTLPTLNRHTAQLDSNSIS